MGEVNSVRDGSAADASAYQPAPGLEDLYGEDYFETRLSNDPERVAQFRIRGRAHPALHPLGPRDGHRLLDGRVPRGHRLAGRALWHGDLRVRAHIALEGGVRFDRDSFSESDFFDLVIIRGTIQHLDEPFLFLKHAFTALRPGGYLVFLATPNTNSPFYRLKKTLPFIDAPRNFYIPDDIGLAQDADQLRLCRARDPLPLPGHALRPPPARPLALPAQPALAAQQR